MSDTGALASHAEKDLQNDGLEIQRVMPKPCRGGQVFARLSVADDGESALDQKMVVFVCSITRRNTDE